MSLYQIVYASRNEIHGEPESVDAEIASILAASRKNNQSKDITGALMFNGSAFAQVLEGPLEHIEAAYERIQCDPRHSDVVLLSNAAATERAFSDWSMGYVDPLLVKSSASIRVDFDDACTGGAGAGGRIVTMLRTLVARESG